MRSASARLAGLGIALFAMGVQGCDCRGKLDVPGVPNRLPVANAGPDQQVLVSSLTALLVFITPAV